MKIRNRIDLESYFPFLLRSISAHIGQGTKTTTIDGCRIGMREWRILALIADHETVTGKDISYHSGMDKGSISRSLKYLESVDLIARTGNSGDWRSKPYKFTKKGASVYETIAEKKAKRAERLWSRLTKTEQKELIKLLQKLKANVYSELHIPAAE